MADVQVDRGESYCPCEAAVEAVVLIRVFHQKAKQTIDGVWVVSRRYVPGTSDMVYRNQGKKADDQGASLLEHQWIGWRGKFPPFVQDPVVCPLISQGAFLNFISGCGIMTCEW